MKAQTRTSTNNFLLRKGNYSKSMRPLMLLGFRQRLYICWNIGGGKQQNIFQVVIMQASS